MKTTKEFGTNLPRIIEVKKNDHKTVIFNKISESTISLEENSTLILAGVVNKGEKNNQKITFEFKGENASLKFLAFVIGEKDNSFNFETTALHYPPKTKASFSVISAMFDNSSVKYAGNIIIEKDSEKTDSSLTHKTILLSENATVETTPSLEIKTDDVSAGHSVSTGKPDEEMLYYLSSRGIDRKTATNLMVKGFLENALKLVADATVREILAERIDTILTNHLK